MNKLFLIAVVLCFFTDTFSQNWSKEKSQNGITIYCSKSDKFSMKASKAEMVLPYSPEEIMKAIKNVSEYPKWVPNCIYSKVLNEKNKEVIYHSEIKAPWPALNRDLVVHLEEVPLTNGFKILMKNRQDFIAERKDVVRVPVYFGEWSILETKEGSLVVLEFQTEPGGEVPDWMAQGAAIKTPFEMFMNLKEYLK